MTQFYCYLSPGSSNLRFHKALSGILPIPNRLWTFLILLEQRRLWALQILPGNHQLGRSLSKKIIKNNDIDKPFPVRLSLIEMPWEQVEVTHRPVSIVLVKCWKVAHQNAKKLLKIAKNPKRCLLNLKSCFRNFWIFLHKQY